MNNIRIYTIGVYGFNEEVFIDTLTNNKIDTLIDIRLRRGVRGSSYKYANSKYLQQLLYEIGIRYHHIPELAPTQEIRNIQKQADRTTGILKSQRKVLDQKFIEKYRNEILNNYDFDGLINRLTSFSTAIALFCVERNPEACHRSIVAEELHQKYTFSLEHLLP